jgi:CRP/FNR family transcriptional regulator
MVTATLELTVPKRVGPEFLRQSPYFKGLDDELLERIGRMMQARSVEKHEIIWLEEEPAKMIYFVGVGLIKLFKTSPAGKEQILRLVQPSEAFGHAGALNGGSNPESAQAIVPSVIYGLASADLKALLGENQQLAQNTIKVLATEMHHYMSLVEDLSLRCVSGRLAKMLLADDGKGEDDASPVLTRADMAAMAGTVREVIGKTLKALEDKGIIRYNRHKIVIRNREALQTIMKSA